MKETSFKIIPRPKAKASVKNTVLVIFSLLVFLVPLATFLLFQQYLNPQMKNKQKSLETELMSLDNRDNQNLRNDIIKIANKIADFEFLTKQHKITSQLFSFISSTSHKRVQIMSLKLSVPNMMFSCEALTDRFKTFGEQILILKNNSNVKGLSVKSASLGEKGINFGFDIDVADSLFAPASAEAQPQ